MGDGSLFNGIRNKVYNLQLENAVYMLGKKSNTEEYFSASDVFVMPSLHEGMPVTLVEAQANSLPCLASEVIDRTIDYGAVSFYSLDKSADEWAKSIQSMDLSRRQPAALLKKEYDINNVINLLRGLYEA